MAQEVEIALRSRPVGITFTRSETWADTAGTATAFRTALEQRDQWTPMGVG